MRKSIRIIIEHTDNDTDNNPLTSSDFASDSEEDLPEPNNNQVEREQIAPPVEQPQEPNNHPVEPEQNAPPIDENLNNIAPVVNHPVAHNANMEHFPHLYGLRPPRFESRKSDIRKFFQRFNAFLAQNPEWKDQQKVGYLSNLIDDEGLHFFESIPAEVRANYENKQQAFINHYDSVQPPRPNGR